MRVLHVVPYYEPAWSHGGVVRAVSGLARRQAESGHRITVLTTDTGGAGNRLPAGRVMTGDVTVVRVRNFSNSIRAKLNVSTPLRFGRVAGQLIEELDIDLVHCHELRTVENLQVRAVARRFNLPLVLSPHGTLPYGTGRGLFKKNWDWLFAASLLRGFDHVVALNQQEVRETRALWSRYRVTLDPEQLTVVPNGIDPSDFAKLPDRDESRRRWNLGPGPVVVFLGRLTERKGLQLLIPAFARLIREMPTARLLLAGPDDGMERRLRDLAVDCQVGTGVVFTGMLDGDARLAALRAADVFVLPAEGEGLSMAALEAMACGLPVILTPGCNFPEVAAAGAGMVVPREVAALAHALQSLLTDSEGRLAMARRAQELVFDRYVWPRILTRMNSAYQAASTSRRSQSEVTHPAD